MGYLPPGADERRLYHLESRFAPLARHLIGTYAGQRVPLAPCQEAVARWFGHPHWHAVVTRQARAASRLPAALPTSPIDDRQAPDEQAWLHEVPLKTLKSLAVALQTQLNLYRDHDRGPSMRWTDARTFDLMARVAGFQSGLEMNQAWAARRPGNRAHASWWTRLKDVLLPTPPDGPWTWARSRMDLPTSSTHPAPSTMLPPEPIVRALGQDLDSGWWMGMTSSQARTHTLLLGDRGTGRDTVLAGWVSDAMRQGQSVAWFTAHEVERSEQIERLFNEQARLCLRHTDRMTLNLTNRPSPPESNPVHVNLFDSYSAGSLTEIVVGTMWNDDTMGQMWKGRSISLVSAVLFALVWERDHQGLPLSLARLREAIDLRALHNRSQNLDLPQNCRSALEAYLRSLPGYVSIETMTATAIEQHTYQCRLLMKTLDAWQPFEQQLFSIDPHRVRWHDLCLPSAMLPATIREHRLLLVIGGASCPPSVQALLLGAVRTRIATRLGEKLDDDYATVVEPPPRPSSPALLVCDNVAMTQLPGMAVLPAQARASNIAMVQAMDDLDDLCRASASPHEWASFLGNCVTRVLMRQPRLNTLREHWALLAPNVEHRRHPGPLEPHWAMLGSNGRRSLNLSEANASTLVPVEAPLLDGLLHYAIGEALVLYQGQVWHVGLMANLLNIHA